MSNFSDRIKNLDKIISEFQKEDNINNLTRVNAVCNTIENQLGKQHTTKLFKNLQEAEAVELDIIHIINNVIIIFRILHMRAIRNKWKLQYKSTWLMLFQKLFY